MFQPKFFCISFLFMGYIFIQSHFIPSWIITFFPYNRFLFVIYMCWFICCCIRSSLGKCHHCCWVSVYRSLALKSWRTPLLCIPEIFLFVDSFGVIPANIGDWIFHMVTSLFVSTPCRCAFVAFSTQKHFNGARCI